jgi:amino acid transporter
MGSARLLYAIAREGHLPSWACALTTRTAAPVGAIAVLGVFGVAAAAVITLYQLYLAAATISAAIVCFVYAGLMAAALRLRRRSPRRPPYVSPVHPAIQWAVIALLPALGVASLISVALVPALWGLAGLAALSAGLAAWAIAHRQKQAVRAQGASA